MSDQQPTEMADFVAIIAGEQDPKMRATLSLFFGLFSRLEKKIDKFLRDEHALRATVLNGHAGNHSSDHDEWGRFQKQLPRVIAATEWVEARVEHGGMCPWATEKKAAEDAIDAAETTAKVKAKWDARTAVITAFLSVVAAGFGAWFLGLFHGGGVIPQ